MIDILILFLVSHFSTSDYECTQCIVKTIYLNSGQEYLTAIMDVKNSPLNITTDKDIYNITESINIKITNNGENIIAFPDSSLGLEFVNINTGESFGFPGVAVLTTLGSNETNTSLVNLTNAEIPVGTYKIILKPLEEIGQISTNITIK